MAFFIPRLVETNDDGLGDQMSAAVSWGASLSLTYGIYVFPSAGSIHVCCTVRHPSGSAPVKINRYDGQCLHEIQTT